MGAEVKEVWSKVNILMRWLVERQAKMKTEEIRKESKQLYEAQIEPRVSGWDTVGI